MLSKSQFKKYLDAPLHLWAYINGMYNRKEDDFGEHIHEQGLEVEKLFGEYLKKHISTNYIYQKEFEYNKFTCITDYIVPNENNSAYDVYEVKSSTKNKQEFEYDTAFQYYILKNLRLVEHIYLVTLNERYIRGEQLDISQLYVITDMTQKANELYDEMEIEINEALAITQLTSPDNITPCNRPKTCPCPQLCFPNLPQYSIYELANINEKRILELKDMGVSKMIDIPNEYGLGHRQRLQIQSLKEQKPVIDKARINEFISNLKFPLYFLDYEAFGWAIPKYINNHVFQDVVFQYSLHILNSWESEPTHFEYISLDLNEPTHELLKKLMGEMGEDGSVIVWNKLFEKGCNRDMARTYPEFKEELYRINSRIVDLGDIFSKQMYVDYRFNGSWSIKNVLPILIPELDYKKMNIHNGSEAMSTWEKLVENKIDPKIKDQTVENMLRYCELDTYAMYKILMFLKSI